MKKFRTLTGNNDDNDQMMTMTTMTITTAADDNGYDDDHNHKNQGKRFTIILKHVTDSKELSQASPQKIMLWISLPQMSIQKYYFFQQNIGDILTPQTEICLFGYCIEKPFSLKLPQYIQNSDRNLVK
jgi:hypothetical protein